MEVEAWLYDGVSAVRQRVAVRAGASGSLALVHGDGREETLPRDQLCPMESRRGEQAYGRRDVEGWRLGLAATPAEIAALLPKSDRYGGWIDRIGLFPAVLIGVAVTALVLFGVNRFPAAVAPLIPPAWEKSFGNALVGDFGGKFCTGAPGQAALARLTSQLSPDPGNLNVRVVHIGLVNAAALPGGNIVIFDGLLKEAKSPDEVAGVLAHEIGHVEERHVTQALIRQYGIGALLGAFGGTAGSGIDALDSLRYTRGAEGEADGDAIQTLARAGISPVPTADFFNRLGRQEEILGKAGRGLAYLSTHPLSSDREARFRASAAKGAAYRPALTPAQWQALVAICRPD